MDDDTQAREDWEALTKAQGRSLCAVRSGVRWLSREHLPLSKLGLVRMRNAGWRFNVASLTARGLCCAAYGRSLAAKGGSDV